MEAERGRTLSKPAHRAPHGAAREDRSGNRALQWQPPCRSGRGPRPSLQPDQPSKKGFRLSHHGGQQKPGRLFPRSGDDPLHCRSCAARQQPRLRLRRSGCQIPCSLHAFIEHQRAIEADDRFLQRNLARIDRLGDDPRAVLIRHQYVFALIWSARYREADAMQQETSALADRLADSRSKAYSLAGKIHLSTIIAPKPRSELDVLKREAIKAASNTADAYIQNWTRFVIGREEFHRGRMTEARDVAQELMQVGRLLGDPRSTGLGLALMT